MPQVINNLDLKKNEIQNVVLQPLSTPPSNPKLGQKYFNINDKNEYRWNGTAWVTYQTPLSTTAASTISIPNGIVKGDGSTLTAATAGTDYQAPLPSQAGNSGKYLTTNGSVLSWASPPGAPVTSVNTKTGDVVLTAADVGAATSSDISTAINALDGGTIGTGSTTKTITSLSQTNGNVSATFSDIAFPVTSVNTKTGAVSLTAADVGAATSSDISTAINALDGSITGTAGAGKTFTAFSQTNGKVTATFGDISITKSQVSDFPTSMTPTSHASSTTTYGIGTDSDYGHVKLSDSTTSTSSTSSGIAATPAAVKAVKDAIPNVPSWAMAATKPTYTASEVGAQPAIGNLNGILKGNGSGGIVTATAGTDYATPSQIPNVPSWAMAATKPTYTATEVGAIPTSAKGAASGVAPLNASSQIDPSYLPSYVDDVIEGYYNSTDGKFYEESTYTTEIPAEAGKIYIDLSTNKSYRWGGTTYVEMPTGSTVTVSPTLTSGEEVGTITIDGTTTTLYAPEGTDTKVTQTKATYSSYTYWRAVPVGTLSSSTPTGAFGTSTTTDREYSFDNLRFWPQYGWIRTHAFNPAPTAANTTASYNNMTSDSINNIYFRINATAYNNGDTVMTLYSNGTDMQVRPGGQYDDKVDLGKPTVRWKDLYLSGEIYADNSTKLLPTVTASDNGKILAVVNGTWQAVELSSLLTIYNGETS